LRVAVKDWAQKLPISKRKNGRWESEMT